MNQAADTPPNNETKLTNPTSETLSIVPLADNGASAPKKRHIPKVTLDDVARKVRGHYRDEIWGAVNAALGVCVQPDD